MKKIIKNLCRDMNWGLMLIYAVLSSARKNTNPQSRCYPNPQLNKKEKWQKNLNLKLNYYVILLISGEYLMLFFFICRQTNIIISSLDHNYFISIYL